MGKQHWRAPGRFAVGVIGAVAGLGLVAAACQPVAAPPPPPPATCDAASQATPTPTPQHPVSYAAVVRHQGWAAPQATSFTATSEADKDAQIAQLQSAGTVLAVGPNQILKAQSDPPVQTANYPDFPLQWGLHTPPGADFQPAWNLGFSGGGERVAVVDTGVDLHHQGLSGRVVAGPDFVLDPNFLTHPATGTLVNGDPDGHGTHVAGIIADADTSGGLGGAPNATIVAVRVLDQSGSGTDVAVANGIIWAATTGHANVINLSLGATGCDMVLQTAMQTAWNAGVVVVAAAGNDGSNEQFSPAGYSAEAIAVAATDENGNKSSFSNDGSFVSIAAPGQDILSTCAWTPACIVPEGGTTPSDTAYGYLDGTSMATPFVSAAAALIKEECPGFSANQIKAELVNHAGPAVPGFAFHRLDAGAAVTAHCT